VARFRDLWTRGTPYGCLAAAVLVTILAVPLLFALAWGGAHCEPVPSCQRGGELHFFMQLAILLACAALLSALVRWLIDRLPALPPIANALLIVGAAGLSGWVVLHLLVRMPW
jgi:hypothetical protein